MLHQIRLEVSLKGKDTSRQSSKLSIERPQIRKQKHFQVLRDTAQHDRAGDSVDVAPVAGQAVYPIMLNNVFARQFETSQ
jgi:hypothetical protein